LESHGQLWMGFRFHRKIWDVPRGFCNAREDSKDVREMVPKLSHRIWASRWSAVPKTRFLIHKCHTYLCVWDPSWLVIGMNYAPSKFSWAIWTHPIATLTMWVDRVYWFARHKWFIFQVYRICTRSSLCQDVWGP
jgi:hypothetical protein